MIPDRTQVSTNGHLPPAQRIEQLERENAELRDRIDTLEWELR